MDYENLTDSELVELANSGDEDATNNLLYKYRYIVKALVRGFFLAGGSTDDLIQEGMMGLYKAIRDYDITRCDNFKNFAYICVKNHIYDAIKKATRDKHSPLNNYISLTAPIGDGDNMYLLDTISLDGDNPEQILIDGENLEVINDLIKSSLSKKENIILEYYLLGDSYIEIADKTGFQIKAIDNELKRIKTKLLKLLDM